MGIERITDIFGVMLLTSTTGMILLAVWWCIQKCKKVQGLVKLVRQMLIVCVASFLIPILHIIIWRGRIVEGGMTGTFLGVTPTILNVLLTIYKIWGVGVIVALCYYGIGFWKMHRIKKRAFSVDQKYNQLLNECQKQIKQKKKVELLQSYVVHTPVIMGVFKPVIYIPAKGNYTEEEWRLLLLHELIHCKHNDILIKYVTAVINCIYCFHPAAWVLSHCVNQWSELYCDDTVKDNIDDVRQYSELLLKVSIANTVAWTNLSAPFFERKINLKRRIRYMMCKKELKKKTWKQAAVIVSAFTLLSSSSVWAAGELIQEGYDKVYKTTQVGIVEESQIFVETEELRSHISQKTHLEIIDEEDTGIDTASTFKEIYWTIGNNQLYRSNSFYATQGSAITVSFTIQPSGKKVSVGIEEPDGRLRYVVGSDSILHRFTVQKAGYHRIYIENESGTTITADGFYNY